MEHFGVWKGREVYTTTFNEYVKYKYYIPDDAVAFWITDDNTFVADNRVVGKIVRELGGRITVDDTVKNAGSKYYYPEWSESRRYTETLKDKLCEEIGVNKEDLFAGTNSDSVDELLASVYTSKLWED